MTPPTLPSVLGARTSIAIIGAGPRGTSILERIEAQLTAQHKLREAAPLTQLDLHLIDDAPAGAGRIWRTDQPRELCMNTVAHAVTLFTEPASTVAGPITEGPTLYEWAVLALHDGLRTGQPGITERFKDQQQLARTHFGLSGTTLMTAALGSTTLGLSSLIGPALSQTGIATAVSQIPASHRESYSAHPARATLVADYAAELAHLRPQSHPSRALYGEYLSWCYERAAARLPSHVQLHRHRSRAIKLSESGPREQLELADGTVILADAVILATGWLPRKPTTHEQVLADAIRGRNDTLWVRPESPIRQDLSAVAPGSHAIVRGLGMGFFDTVSLLTLGRGGSFVTDRHSNSGLRYQASGREPLLHVTSNRGVPFRAKTLYPSLPPSSPQRFLKEVDWNARTRPLNFDQEFWPRVVADAFLEHASTLSRHAPGAVTVSTGAILTAIRAALHTRIRALREEPSHPDQLRETVRTISAAVAPFIPSVAQRFPLLEEMRPAEHPFPSSSEFTAWLTARISEDLEEAKLGQASALKAGLWSISSARGVAQRVGTLGGFDADSRGSGFAAVMSIGAMAGSGPPAFRIAQLLALMEAGIVRFIGPQSEVTVSAQGFRAQSPTVAGSRVEALTLIDAWMHAHDLSASADPLMLGLHTDGRARPFKIQQRSGGWQATSSPEVDPVSGQLVRADGKLEHAVHLTGIPVDEQVHGTFISPIAGSDPPMLRETDRVAAIALQFVQKFAHMS